MFKDERDAAHQAVEAITNPTTVAIDALADAAESVVDARDVLIGKLNEELESTTDRLTTTLALADGLRAQLVKIPPFGLADIEKHPDWKVNWGTKVGSSKPVFIEFGNMDVPDSQGNLHMMAAPDGTRGVMKFSARQDVGLYGDVLISKNCPPPAPDQREMIYPGRFWVTPESILAWQALEIDNKLILLDPADETTKWEQNFSSHIDQHGELCISGDTPWKPTGIKLGGIPAAGMWHEFQWEYAWDMAAHTYTFVAFTFDGTRYLIPDSFANMVAKTSTWGVQTHPQLQWSLNTAGKTATAYFDRLRYGQ